MKEKVTINIDIYQSKKEEYNLPKSMHFFHNIQLMFASAVIVTALIISGIFFFILCKATTKKQKLF